MKFVLKQLISGYFSYWIYLNTWYIKQNISPSAFLDGFSLSGEDGISLVTSVSVLKNNILIFLFL